MLNAIKPALPRLITRLHTYFSLNVSIRVSLCICSLKKFLSISTTKFFDHQKLFLHMRANIYTRACVYERELPMLLMDLTCMCAREGI